MKLANFSSCQSGEYYITSGRGEYLQDMAPECISDGDYSTKSDV